MIRKHGRRIEQSNLTTLYNHQSTLTRPNRPNVPFSNLLRHKQSTWKRFGIGLVGSSRIYQVKYQLSREKDRNTIDEMSGIYKIACAEYSKVYIGQASW